MTILQKKTFFFTTTQKHYFSGFFLKFSFSIFSCFLFFFFQQKKIWSPQGGDLVPSTLPAAEPSILARGKIGNLTCANRGVFRAQIPRVRGPNSLPSRFSQKRPSKQSPKKARNHYFYSVFAHFGSFLRECPKNTKNPSCRECYYPMSFSRGLFLYKFPFFFSNFKLARFTHSDLRTVLKPLFL